jgi:hypothetical protein
VTATAGRARARCGADGMHGRLRDIAADHLSRR